MLQPVVSALNVRLESLGAFKKDIGLNWGRSRQDKKLLAAILAALSPKIGEVVQKEMEKPIDTCNIGLKFNAVKELAQEGVVDIAVEKVALVVLGKSKQLFLCKRVR